ncbi:MAG: Gfo/Idh/MocA family protein [Planctomycetota bacterium]|jgi:myo-inositol 2-dehydrogenase/D-chiro-inositol 1-dehydrogenase
MNDPRPHADHLRPDERDALLSRRRFVQTSAALAAVPIIGGGALSATAAAQEATGSTLPPLKVGLVGCGGRGTGAALQALRADEGAVLHALADVFEPKLDRSLRNISNGLWPKEEETDDEEEKPEKPIHPRCQVTPERKFVGFDAYQRLIDSGVDVVLLATPPGFRPWHLTAAIDAGKHVFCEKPMATDGPGVRMVLEAAKRAKEKSLSLMSGFCWRYHHAKRATMAEIENGRIGDLRTIYTTYNTGPLGRHDRKPEWSDWEFQLRNWQHFDHLSGDHLVEQAVHSLDKMMWVAWVMNGEVPDRVTGVGGRIAREGESSGNIYDHFALTYEFPSGVRGFHMSRQIPNCANDNSDLFIGAFGQAYMDWNRHEITGGSNQWRYDGRGKDMYQQEHDELFAAIRSGKPHNDGEWMANSTLCAIMGRMAAYSGRVITWQEALESEESIMPGPQEWGWHDFATNPVPIPGRGKVS